MSRAKKPQSKKSADKDILNPRNFSTPAEIALDPYYELKGRLKKIPTKETQGHRKLVQLVEDLRRNKHFIKDVTNLQKLETFRTVEEAAEDEIKRKDEKGLLNDLVERYAELDEQAKKILDNPYSKFEDKFQEIADKYGLDEELLSDFLVEGLSVDRDLALGDYYDFCMINDVYDELFNPQFYHSPLLLDSRKQSHTWVYPISIEIHKFASKRDVLDFIEKKWDIIESYIEPYRNHKKLRIRTRKISRELTDFVWDNRMLGLKKIKSQLDVKFPKNGMAYNEIGKLISLEKQRRSRKLV